MRGIVPPRFRAMSNNLEPSPSNSVQLNGFAPAAGSSSGVTSSSPPVAAVVSVLSASSTPDAVAATASGGGAPTDPAAATTTTTVPAKRAAKKRGPKNGGGSAGRGGGGGGASSASPPASFSEGDAGGLSEDAALRPLPDVGPGFEPMGLPQIRFRLGSLLERLPRELPDAPPPSSADRGVVATAGVSPAGGEDDTRAQVRSFASALQIAIEEYNLLLSLVSSATYHWGVDRSGASQQNLSVMSAELQQCQDVIANVVSSRLSNVLCPAVDIMVGEIEIIKGGVVGSEEDGVGEMDASSPDEGAAPPAKRRKLPDDEDRPTPTAAAGGGGGNERRINRYIRPLVDPSYVHLCDCILARNAAMIRHTVATSIHTAQRVIGDYLNAMKKDTSHEAGKGGYY